MNEQLLDQLKQRHFYQEWRGATTLEENLFIWQFFLSGNELPGWQAHRIRPVATEGRPSSIQSIWQRAEGGTEELLSVDVFECASRTTAHEYLLRLLGEFQSSEMARQKQTRIGDVAFAAPEDTTILSARGNIIVLVRNAGRNLAPITEIASQFDRDLASRPETEEGKVVPDIVRFQSIARELQVGVSTPLEVEAVDPLERPLWYKFFSSHGEVLLEEGSLVYRPGSSGSQGVTVFAINANRGAASQELQFNVR